MSQLRNQLTNLLFEKVGDNELTSRATTLRVAMGELLRQPVSDALRRNQPRATAQEIDDQVYELMNDLADGNDTNLDFDDLLTRLEGLPVALPITSLAEFCAQAIIADARHILVMEQAQQAVLVATLPGEPIAQLIAQLQLEDNALWKIMERDFPEIAKDIALEVQKRKQIEAVEASPLTEIARRGGMGKLR